MTRRPIVPLLVLAALVLAALGWWLAREAPRDAPGARVTADGWHVIHESGAEVALRPAGSADSGYLPVEIRIRRGTACFGFEAEFVGAATLDDALAATRATLMHEHPYLLVTGRVGGNTRRALHQELFLIEEQGLRHLGEVGLPDAPGDQFAHEPAAGRFVDLYDELAANRLTSHAQSPVIRIGLVVRDGRLAVDGERTWALNEPVLAANRARLTSAEQAGSRSEAGRGPDAETLLPPLLENAAIARYAGRAAVLREQRDFVATRFGAEWLREFDAALNLVRPGALPEALTEVTPCAATR